MKKSLLLLVVMTLTQQAQAGCLTFLNGKGPNQIGNIALVAPATEVCIYRKNRVAGSTVTMVEFKDTQGELATFTADLKSQGRGPGIFRVYELNEGTSNAYYANAKGIEITIEASEDQHLQMVKGTLTIEAGRGFPQTYLVMSKN